MYMPVSRHPPHRSVREELPHTAPTSGNNAETSGLESKAYRSLVNAIDRQITQIGLYRQAAQTDTGHLPKAHFRNITPVLLKIL